MTNTRIYKLFFALIFLEAIPVAVLGFFFPAQLNSGFSWVALPPLHARFVAALYFFGVVFMLGCLLAREWQDVRLALPLIVIWTGLLFIVSLLHLDDFDFDKIQVWIWMGAYFLDPVIALFIIWGRRQDYHMSASSLPTWIRGYLMVQGGIFSVLALALLFVPNTMVNVWAWSLGTTLAQYYAGPLLAYGVGSLVLGWQGNGSQLRIAAPAMLAFTAAALIASVMHDNLFSSGDISDVLWFAGFITATLVHLFLTAQVVKR
jgi:hypothetical protein